MIRELSRKASIGCQEFVVRNDCPCGSTIGPMIAAHTVLAPVSVQRCIAQPRSSPLRNESSSVCFMRRNATPGR